MISTNPPYEHLCPACLGSLQVVGDDRSVCSLHVPWGKFVRERDLGRPSHRDLIPRACPVCRASGKTDVAQIAQHRQHEWYLHAIETTRQSGITSHAMDALRYGSAFTCCEPIPSERIKLQPLHRRRPAIAERYEPLYFKRRNPSRFDSEHTYSPRQGGRARSVKSIAGAWRASPNRLVIDEDPPLADAPERIDWFVLLCWIGIAIVLAVFAGALGCYTFDATHGIYP